MISQRELDNAIREFENAPQNYENCKKLATFYTIFDHLYSEPQVEKKQQEIIGHYGDSEFLNIIGNRKAEDVWAILDELMETLKVVNPRLYDSVIRKMAE